MWSDSKIAEEEAVAREGRGGKGLTGGKGKARLIGGVAEGEV